MIAAILLLNSRFCSDSRYPGLDSPPVIPDLNCRAAGGMGSRQLEQPAGIAAGISVHASCAHWGTLGISLGLQERKKL